MSFNSGLKSVQCLCCELPKVMLSRDRVRLTGRLELLTSPYYLKAINRHICNSSSFCLKSRQSVPSFRRYAARYLCKRSSVTSERSNKPWLVDQCHFKRRSTFPNTRPLLWFSKLLVILNPADLQYLSILLFDSHWNFWQIRSAFSGFISLQAWNTNGGRQKTYWKAILPPASRLSNMLLKTFCLLVIQWRAKLLKIMS